MDMVSAIGNLNILEKMSTIEAADTSNPMFKVMRPHMRMVMEMLAFIRAVRTGDRSPNLITLEMFTKYLFAHDKINYARTIPVYLAEISSFKTSEPTTQEFFFLERESFSAGKNLQKRIHQLSLPLQNLGKLLIRIRKLSQPLRSLSVFYINREQ